MFGWQILPSTLKRHYTNQNVGECDVDSIFIHCDDDIQTLEVNFKDDTTDIWRWIENPNPRDPLYRMAWTLTEEKVLTSDLEMEPV